MLCLQPNFSEEVPSFHTRSPKTSSTLSIDDICSSADKERTKSARHARSHIIQIAQLQALNRKGARTPDTLSLPSLSRPQTVADFNDSLSVFSSNARCPSQNERADSPVCVNQTDRPETQEGQNQDDLVSSQDINDAANIGNERMDNADNLSVKSYPTKKSSMVVVKRKVSSAPGGSTRRCMRVQSAVEREKEGVANSLSRQCCDVLGPKACHECALVHRTVRDDKRYMRYNNGQTYPNLHVSEDNFAAAQIIKKNMPGVPQYVIHAKVARGEISRLSFRERLDRSRELQKERAERAKAVAGEKCLRLLVNNNLTYFQDIQRLSDKITSGEMERKIILKPGDDLPKQRESSPSYKRELSAKSVLEELYPTFISSKKIKEEKSSYLSFYEPPLLPKVCQNVQPAFFAGSSKEYKLPSYANSFDSD